MTGEDARMDGTHATDIRAFLLRHRLCADAFDWEAQLATFMEEMDRVRAGGKGSLQMIPFTLRDRALPDEPVSVTAVDVGGTNVRSARVTLDRRGVLDIRRLPAFRTPGIGGPMSVEEFYRAIVSGIADHLDTDRLGICFSLAAAPLPDGDAVVTAGAKQLDVAGLVGSRVGAGFRDAARALGLPCGQKITVVNDTLAAALGGRLDAGGGRYSGYVGFIYGTGTNTAYREPSGALINVESGAYCGFPTGDIDDLYDRGHIDPGRDRFEKMVSGGYQGGLMTLVLRSAEGEGLLSRGFSQRLEDALAGAALGSAAISAFCRGPSAGPIAAACATEDDRAAVSAICRGMTERSALLCGVTVAAALLKARIGLSADAPAFITAEGSTYLKQVGFRDALEAVMAEYAGKRLGLHYEFHTVPDAVMKGTAVAALG